MYPRDVQAASASIFSSYFKRIHRSAKLATSHPIVPLLDAFKTEQQPLELIFPRKGPLDMHPQGMDHSIEQPLAPTLGAPAVAGVLCDVGDHPRIKYALAIRSGVKAAVEIDLSASEVQPDLFRHLFQRFQALR